MKSEFKAKFLSHLLKRKDNEGFTLIELLVVIIIIGILSAIALPSFLNQASKAKQSEAKNYVGAVQRAQQAYRIENAQFAETIETLQIGIPESTENYSYSMEEDGDAFKDKVGFIASTTDPTALKGFSSGVVVLSSGQTSAASCQTTATQEQSNSGTVVIPVLDATDGAECDAAKDMQAMK